MAGYTKTGPFVNGGAPGISASFLNNAETWLAYAADSLITTNGAGALTVVQAVLTTGSLSRISKFTGAAISGKVTVNHGLGATPDFIILSWNLTGTPSAATIGYNASTLSSTQVDVWASIAANFVGLAIKF